jgi:hypothetical protein
MNRRPKVKTRVPLAVAKFRALAYLKKHPNELVKAADVAGEIWPGVEFRAQGAGGAASRILKLLEREGLVRWWTSQYPFFSWGWQLIASPEPLQAPPDQTRKAQGPRLKASQD